MFVMGCTPSILSDNSNERKDSGLFGGNVTSNSGNNNSNNNKLDLANNALNQVMVNSTYALQKDENGERVRINK